MADLGNHPESTQAGHHDPSPLSDLAQSIVSRFRGTRSMLSPWIQRTLADQPASTAAGEPRQISLSGGHTDRLLNKVQRQTAESQVWQPDIGSLKPDFVERFATNIVERFPATDTKYAAQPLTSASSDPANLVLVGDPAQPVSHAEEPGTQSQSSSSETENWPTLADLQRAVEAKAKWTPSSSSPGPPPTPVQRTTTRPVQPASPAPSSPPRPRRIFSRVEEVTPSGTTSIRTRSSGQESGETESVQKQEETAPPAAGDSAAATREADTRPPGPSRPETPPIQRQPDQPRPISQPGPVSQPEVRPAPGQPEARTPRTLQPTDQPLPTDRPAGPSVQRQPDRPEPLRSSQRSRVEEIGVVRAEDSPSSITDPDQPGPAVEPESGTSQATETSTSPPVQRATGQKPPTQAEPSLSATRPKREATTSEPRQSVQRQPDGEIAPQTKSPSSLSGEAGPDRPELASLPDRDTEPAGRTPGEEAAAGPTEETVPSRAASKSSPQTVQRQVEPAPITSRQPEAPEPDRPERLPPVSRAEQSEPSLEDEAEVVPSKEASSSSPSPESHSRQGVQRQSESAMPLVQREESKPDRLEPSPPSSKGDQPEVSVDEAEIFDRIEGPPPRRRSETMPRQAVQRQPEPDLPSIQREEIKPGWPQPSPDSKGDQPGVSFDETGETHQATTAPETEFVQPERPADEVAGPGRQPAERPSPPGIQRQPDELASPQPPATGAEEYVGFTQPEKPDPPVEDWPASSPRSDRPDLASRPGAGSTPAVQRYVDRTEVNRFEAARPQHVEEMEEVQQPPAQAKPHWPEVEETESPQQPEAPAPTKAGPDVSQQAETVPGVQRQRDQDLPVAAEPPSPVLPTEPGPLPVPPRSEVESAQAKLETSAQEPGRETQPTSSKVQRQPEPDSAVPTPPPSPVPGRPSTPMGETGSPESPAPSASEQEPASSSSDTGDLPAESPVQRQPDEAAASRPGLEEDILARASSKANLPLAKPMSPASRFKSSSGSSRNGAQAGSSPASPGPVQARFESSSAGQPESTPLVLNQFRPPAPQGTVSEVGRSGTHSRDVQRAVADPFPAPRDLPLPPPVQRAPATDQSAETVQRSDETSATGAATGAGTGASGQDLDKLAREVYPIIKRLLAVERERVTGLLRRR